MDDTALMRRALLQAARAKQAGELPYGAVLASRDGRILAETHDEVAARRDPTAHAELLAVQRAAAQGFDLSGCRLVSTAEGCAMCMMAAWLAGVAVAQYGASMAEIKALRADALDEIGVPATELAARFERRLDVRAGLLREDCLALWRSPDRAPSA